MAPLHVAVIGCGLIGGSLGMALRMLPGCGRYVVHAFDREAGRAGEAVQMGAADVAAASIREAVAGADLVVAAVPAEEVAGTVREASSHAPPSAVLTDVASIKGPIVEALAGKTPGGQAFVGGHPMAGSERAGLVAADPFLFQNAVYVLTPVASSPPAAVQRVREMAEAAGAQVVTLSPEEHDAAVAAASHLPHVAAVGLVLAAEACARDGVPVLQLAATGFRDVTRLAMGHEDVWKPILMMNRARLVEALRAFRDALDRIERAVATGDGEAVQSLLQRARALRQAFRLPAKGYGRPIWDLVVRLADRPGAIASVAGALAEEGLNIADIEILRVREGEAGTLRVGFVSEAAMLQAVQVLRRRGLQAWPR
ncbi:prephenate dehydrogenase/arogenate dehydrogenase family protein [Carboxydochorda subterranea]|uniref:Prephenate dehydrogenase n=1 Tax=Carboxydichorda subterranea TaxID=3109565 RepID=A0ABZ1C123_9FIRM|nr:prephenate dehydrogenase/arogenate dehydrogenase family protein [Limnochorda sp. L945t]WRP18560.1 prephenate dehydrogenase/arogenate dehydrogenase family protein [Limnochorda sp. L945t]